MTATGDGTTTDPDDQNPGTPIPFDAAITPATPLRGLPLAVVDTETTGLPPCDVVELCILRTAFGVDFAETPENVYLVRVRPTRPIHPKARELHGIGFVHVAQCPTWDLHPGPSVARWMAGAVPLAYNAAFDYGVIRDANRAIGAEVPPWPWLDPFVWARALWGVNDGRNGHEGNRLTQVAERLGITPNGDPHGAYVDAQLAHAVARPLLMGCVKAGKAPAVRTVGELFAWQIAEAVRQETQLPDHFDKPWTKLHPGGK